MSVKTKENSGTEIDPAAAAAAFEKQRFSVNLSPKAYSDLKELADQTGRSMAEIIRIGIGLVRVIFQELNANHKLIVTSSSGKPLKEIVLPW